ncbi:hypothetical protein ACLOJK_014988 [Asimina triloba]
MLSPSICHGDDNGLLCLPSGSAIEWVLHELLDGELLGAGRTRAMADLSPRQAAVGGRRAALDGDVEVTMVASTRDGWTLDLMQLDVTALLMGRGLLGVVEEGGGAARLWI